MADLTELFNRTLFHLNDTPLATADDVGKAPEALRIAWPTVRDKELREHPWNCAKASFSIPADATPPDLDWSASYTMPASPYCLRVLRLSPRRTRFITAGRKILTNAGAPLLGWMIIRLEDPGDFDASLFEVAALALAIACCFRITGDADTDRLEKRYLRGLAMARSMNAFEGTAEDHDPEEEMSELESCRW